MSVSDALFTAPDMREKEENDRLSARASGSRRRSELSASRHVPWYKKDRVANKAIIVTAIAVIAAIVTTIVYLFESNARKVRELAMIRNSLETIARMKEKQMAAFLRMNPLPSDGVINQEKSPTLYQMFRSYNMATIIDSGRVFSLEVIHAETGSIYASSLRPEWSTQSDGAIPGQSLKMVLTESDEALGDSVHKAAAKGGGFVEYEYTSPGMDRVFRRMAYVIPVSGTRLVVMVGTDM